MTRLTPLITMIVTVSVCIALAPVNAEETAPAPAEQTQPAAQLPEGHPPLPEGHPQLPQGHPPIPAKEAKPVVYETTEVEPDWTVVMRHLIVRPMEDHLFITEVWAVNNPTDKQYIGAAVEASDVVAPDEASPAESAPPAMLDEAGGVKADAAHDAGRITLVLPLPASASHVQPGTGFDACCVRVEAERLISSMPMDPGTTQMRVSYLLAPEDGVFDLALPTPAPTGHLMVFLPDDDAQVTARGLNAGDTFKAGDKAFRVYSGKQLETGMDVGLTIRAAPAAEKSVAASQNVGPAAGPDSSGQIKLIAGIGAGVLLVAAMVVLLKPAKKQAPASVVS